MLGPFWGGLVWIYGFWGGVWEVWGLNFGIFGVGFGRFWGDLGCLRLFGLVWGKFGHFGVIKFWG